MGDGVGDDAGWMARRQESWRKRRKAERAGEGKSEPSLVNPRLDDNPYVKGLLYCAVAFAGLGVAGLLIGGGGGFCLAAGTFFVAWMAVSAILWRPPGK